MVKEFEGYVIYGKTKDQVSPFAVVSENYECKATSNYIPPSLKVFLVQVEDKRFYLHRGIDFKGIARAVVANLKAGRVIQGGSSITQQLARNILNDNRKSI